MTDDTPPDRYEFSIKCQAYKEGEARVNQRGKYCAFYVPVNWLEEENPHLEALAQVEDLEVQSLSRGGYRITGTAQGPAKIVGMHKRGTGAACHLDQAYTEAQAVVCLNPETLSYKRVDE